MPVSFGIRPYFLVGPLLFSTFAGMLNEQDKVTIAREILQDPFYKTNFHLLIRVIDSGEVGFIREMDHERSQETGLNYYWVQFYVAAFRIEEKYLVPADDIVI